MVNVGLPEVVRILFAAEFPAELLKNPISTSIPMELTRLCMADLEIDIAETVK